MAYTWECNGPTGLKSTVYKDLNCLEEGSWADFYLGIIGPDFKPSDSLIKGGAVSLLWMDKPTVFGSETVGGLTSDVAFQLNDVHGCKSMVP
eukprot:SAG31_NODE_8417_length_1455_cov_6.994100_1_plen_92_part_00